MCRLWVWLYNCTRSTRDRCQWMWARCEWLHWLGRPLLVGGPDGWWPHTETISQHFLLTASTGLHSLGQLSEASVGPSWRCASPSRSWPMGGLKICLVLCLGYLVATQHQHNQHNEAAKKTSETNFEDLGRFRKSAIGSSVNGITKHRWVT